MKAHPLAALFDGMHGDEHGALRADIKANGLREPIWIYEGLILDGRNRYLACTQLGIECPTREYTGIDPHGFVLSMNLHRRHLNAEQKRKVIAGLLKTTPEKSNHQIAAMAGVSHHTVADVRAELEGLGQIAQVKRRTTSDGKSRPAKQKPSKPREPKPSKPTTKHKTSKRKLPDAQPNCFGASESLPDEAVVMLRWEPNAKPEAIAEIILRAVITNGGIAHAFRVASHLRAMVEDENKKHGGTVINFGTTRRRTGGAS